MAGTTSYYHCDASGNVRALTDSNQNVTDRYTYDAFGNTVAQSGTTENNFRFGGQVGYHLNPDSGSYYVRQREYQPVIIRWLSVDPIGLISDINLYRYVVNTPIAQIDAEGLIPNKVFCECEETLKRLMKGSIETLARCVDKYGCLGTGAGAKIICRSCPDADAYYVHGGGQHDRIELCYENFPKLPPDKQADVLIEELYHALTICEAANKRSNALMAWDEIIDKTLAKGKTTTTKDCAVCYGQEAIAKGCVRVQRGTVVTQPPVGEISASCGGRCNTDDMLPSDPMWKALVKWFNSTAIPSCKKINKNCGLS